MRIHCKNGKMHEPWKPFFEANNSLPIKFVYMIKTFQLWQTVFTTFVSIRKNVKVTVKFRETASETMSSVNKNLIYYNKYNVVVMINGKTYDPLIKR